MRKETLAALGIAIQRYLNNFPEGRSGTRQRAYIHLNATGEDWVISGAEYSEEELQLKLYKVQLHIGDEPLNR